LNANFPVIQRTIKKEAGNRGYVKRSLGSFSKTRGNIYKIKVKNLREIPGFYNAIVEVGPRFNRIVGLIFESALKVTLGIITFSIFAGINWCLRKIGLLALSELNKPIRRLS